MFWNNKKNQSLFNPFKLTVNMKCFEILRFSSSFIASAINRKHEMFWNQEGVKNYIKNFELTVNMKCFEIWPTIIKK